MSRSRKKHNWCKDGNRSSKWTKRHASRRIRRIPIEDEDSDILTNSPSAYKRLRENSYNINDYVDHFTKKDAIKKWTEMQSAPDNWHKEYFFEKYPTLNIYLEKIWARYYSRK